MHDHLEELGRYIVHRLHPDKPHKHTRLWIYDEIEEILANDLGTKATRYIRFYSKKLNPHIVMKGLRKMKELRFLYVVLGDCFHNSTFNNIAIPDFPIALRYLCVKHYPFRSLPKTFQANNLVGLDMSDSNIIQLWEGGENKVLNKMKFLDLSNSKLRTLDLGLTPNLETLNLGRCYDLVDIHMSVECLKLISVNLTRSRLRTLDLRLALNLEMLILAECRDLVELHMPVRCMYLKSLQLTNSKLRTFDIGLTPNLENLNLENCYYLEELHMADECQKLTNLNVSHSKLRTLNLGLTPNLKTLDGRQCCNLLEIHTPIGCLEKLVHLDLSRSLRFKSFVFDIKDYISCSMDKSLDISPLAKLHLIAKLLESCPLHPESNLPKFQIRYFYKEDRPSLTGNSEMLISVGMCACTNLGRFSESICGLQRLRKLKLEGNILHVLKDLDRLGCLEELILLSTTINHLPDSIWMLKHLKSLELNLCVLLEKLPEDLGRLECLEKLDLSYTKIKHLPDSICTLKHLKSLKLDNSLFLEKLPENLGRLECLERLSLKKCDFLQEIPNSICEMKCLNYIYLRHCIRVKKLPEELGRVECLKELDIEGTRISYLPHSMHLLKDVCIIGSCDLHPQNLKRPATL